MIDREVAVRSESWRHQLIARLICFNTYPIELIYGTLCLNERLVVVGLARPVARRQICIGRWHQYNASLQKYSALNSKHLGPENEDVYDVVQG